MAFVIINEWLTFSLIILGVWFIIFLAKKNLRRKMLVVSLFTMLFGLTEPLFVPAYWHPPSLFNLASTTGFDIESFIFSFAVGGIGATIYESVFGAKYVKMSMHEMHSKRHRYHRLAILSPVIAFALLHLFTSLNPIYAAIAAMLVGGIATILCRPDLTRRIITGGLLFLGIYFVFFLAFTTAYPNAVRSIWNLSAISGILIFGIPIEELAFAFTFGLMWSSIYEHFEWYKGIHVALPPKSIHRVHRPKQI